MGRRLIALAADDPHFDVVAAVDSINCPRIGVDAGVIAGIGEIGLPLASVLGGESGVDVVIDFSIPDAAVALARTCAECHIPLVVATTGLSDTEQQTIRDVARQIPIVWSPNTSLAVNLTMKLCETAAAALAKHPAGVDVEILEWHHRFKEDAPSGTALRFGELIAASMGQTRAQHGREGRPGVRPRDEIGYHAIRAGDHPGEHRILFGMPGESIELRVAATSRDSYAQGALVAAHWVTKQPPGLYGMQEVLGL